MVAVGTSNSAASVEPTLLITCFQGEFSSAASLLHSLLWSRLAPKYFWVTLLIDVIPFISMGNDSPVFLGSKQTYDVMQCLHVS